MKYVVYAFIDFTRSLYMGGVHLSYKYSYRKKNHSKLLLWLEVVEISTTSYLRFGSLMQLPDSATTCTAHPEYGKLNL